jgi:hypothetical protein
MIFFPTSEANQMSVGVLTSQLSVVVLALCGLFVTAVLVMFHWAPLVQCSLTNDTEN